MPNDVLLEPVGPGPELPGFDLDDPDLPKNIQNGALKSGGFPYEEVIKRKAYEEELELLQIELLKLQLWVQQNKQRVVIVFEGRDAAGKGGTINAFLQHLNPRRARSIALAKPTEIEEGQWFFQRYITHLPSAGEIVLFDRSWYNRAGVERVMGFCSEEQSLHFLSEVSQFEEALIRDGVVLVKFWLSIGREMQLLRFHARRHHPLKRWKLTNMDVAALKKWDAYTAALHDIFAHTHTQLSPWIVVRSNDKRRARLNAIRALLARLNYAGKDLSVTQSPDSKIVGSEGEFFSI